ncbi:hypothetical protein BJV77DRAFT_1039271 [Russula vinacea]|nr:hypothetical protein BJV77DRAFT_1039271 [Russula vinacea]
MADNVFSLRDSFHFLFFWSLWSNSVLTDPTCCIYLGILKFYFVIMSFSRLRPRRTLLLMFYRSETAYRSALVTFLRLPPGWCIPEYPRYNCLEFRLPLYCSCKRSSSVVIGYLSVFMVVIVLST